MVINVTVVGPFEEEEEGTGITSDVVKVKGEDPATPGPQRIDPGTVTIPQYRLNKTKQHTHTIYTRQYVAAFVTRCTLSLNDWEGSWSGLCQYGSFVMFCDRNARIMTEESEKFYTPTNQVRSLIFGELNSCELGVFRF